jgi:hypothetical protein
MAKAGKNDTKVEACNMILYPHPLRQSNFNWSRDQPRPGSFLKKREEPGNEVGIAIAREGSRTSKAKQVTNLL